VHAMAVASVTEISAISDRGFEHAIRAGIGRATETLRGVQGCWVKDMNVAISDGEITGYRVNLEITFLLEDPGEESERLRAAADETRTAGRAVPVEERPEAGGA
jgi:flavin-binding protein dodecin